MRKSFFEEVSELILLIKHRGLSMLVNLTLRVFVNCLLYPYFVVLKPSKTFVFQNRIYNYYYHWYNTTWANERDIEIPIVMDVVKENSKKKILEVGNVLSHYFHFNHDILDKYEKSKGVINQDIIDFRSPEEYDLIVSISTLEHVGFDETPKDSTKIIRAIENLKGILAPKGKIIITLPLGYNGEMDTMLRNGKIEFTDQIYLKKISKNNTWKEVNSKDIQDIKYNKYLQSANGIVVGIIEKRQ